MKGFSRLLKKLESELDNKTEKKGQTKGERAQFWLVSEQALVPNPLTR